MAALDLVEVAHDRNQSPLLRLPSFLRQRIYLDVGLVPMHWVPGFPGHPYVFQLHGLNKREYCLFHGMMISCRTIYNEASVLLYRSNKFVIRYWDHRSLEVLRNFTPLALANLTNLKVILNEASCHTRNSTPGFPGLEAYQNHAAIAAGVYGTDGNPRLGLPGHDEVISGSDREAEALFTEWELTIDYLCPRISSAVLELSLVCDVAHRAVDAAKRVVAPLDRLPLLKDCHIRLCHLPSPELKRLAQDASFKARGIPTPESPEPKSCSPAISSSPLLGSWLVSLPPELRLQILEYTDLVTPYKEIAWHRQRRLFLASHMRCQDLKCVREACLVRHGYQFVDCWGAGSTPGCFCRVNHSAFSSKCKCWAPPRALFLVCRVLYKEAQVVLFSQNRFIIYDYNCKPSEQVTAGPWPTGPYPFSRFAASVFLDEIVPRDCLRQLRFLKLVYPVYGPETWPKERHAALSDWRETINWAKGRLNLPALTISLLMVFPNNRLDWRPASKSEGKAILAGYDRLLGPLVQLGGEGGLYGFHSDLCWPRRPMGQGRLNTILSEKKWVFKNQRKWNEHAERMVLGDERYKRQYLPGPKVMVIARSFHVDRSTGEIMTWRRGCNWLPLY